MKAIYCDSMKTIPSSKTPEIILRLSDIKVLPNHVPSNISLKVPTLTARTKRSIIDHVILKIERGVSSRTLDQELCFYGTNTTGDPRNPLCESLDKELEEDPTEAKMND